MKSLKRFLKEVDVKRITGLAISLGITLTMLFIIGIAATNGGLITLDVGFEGWFEVVICAIASLFLGNEILKVALSEKHV